MRKKQLTTGIAAALAAAAWLSAATGTPALSADALQQRPAGYQQILPRGRIASIDEPIYVSADAAEIRNEAWVLGVVIDGQARAFSLELLNAHEVVNDSIGDVNFAAVW